VLAPKLSFAVGELCRPQEEKSMKKTVQFDAHKTVKKPAEVEFTTKDGREVDFVASKKTKVPVHVKFKVNVKE